MLTAGTNIRYPDRPAIRIRQDLNIAAMMPVLPGPPHVGSARARCSAPVHRDHRPVQVHMRPTPGLRMCQGIDKARGTRGQNIDPLVQVLVPGRQSDPIVTHQIRHPSSIHKPPQHQDRLSPRR